MRAPITCFNTIIKITAATTTTSAAPEANSQQPAHTQHTHATKKPTRMEENERKKKSKINDK